jgi:hypothetical protein
VLIGFAVPFATSLSNHPVQNSLLGLPKQNFSEPSQAKPACFDFTSSKICCTGHQHPNKTLVSQAGMF